MTYVSISTDGEFITSNELSSLLRKYIVPATESFITGWPAVGRAGGDFSDCSLRPASYVRRCTYLVSRNLRVERSRARRGTRALLSSSYLALEQCTRAASRLALRSLPYVISLVTNTLAHGARAFITREIMDYSIRQCTYYT